MLESPPHELIDVVVRYPDESTHDHHRKSVGDHTHPLDATLVGEPAPQPVGGLIDERFQLPNAACCQLRKQQLPVGSVKRFISGGEGVGLATEGLQLERRDRAIGVERHRRGEVGGKVLGTRDGVDDGVSAAHGEEAGLADGVDRSRVQHPGIQRIGILNELVGEQLHAELAVLDRHLSNVVPGLRYRQ